MTIKKQKLIVKDILASRDKITKLQNNTPVFVTEEEKEFFEERAAIIEFDAGISTGQAEVEAQKYTLAFFHNNLY